MSKKEGAAEVAVKSNLDVSIEEVTHAVAEISKMDALIGELETKHGKTVYPVDTPKALKAAREARAEIRKPRYLIEKVRKAGKAPVLELGRKLDAKAREQTARLLAIEGPIDTAIQEEEDREEREREAAIEAEAARCEAIQARIEDIRLQVELVAWDTPAADILTLAKTVEKIAIDNTFEEFKDRAIDVKTATLARLRELHARAEAQEAEEARIAKEREELDQLRADNERKDNIKARIDRMRVDPEALEWQGCSSEQIASHMKAIKHVSIDESFEEFRQEATDVKELALSRLGTLHGEAVDREQAAAKERAELEERERKVNEENDRLARERQRFARRQDIQNQITNVRGLPAQGHGKTAAELSRLLARAQGFRLTVDEEDSDLLVEASAARVDAIAVLESMLERQKADEAAAERKRKAEAAAKKARYPGDQAIVEAVAFTFTVNSDVAQKWLKQYGRKAKSKRAAA